MCAVIVIMNQVKLYCKFWEQKSSISLLSLPGQCESFWRHYNGNVIRACLFVLSFNPIGLTALVSVIVEFVGIAYCQSHFKEEIVRKWFLGGKNIKFCKQIDFHLIFRGKKNLLRIYTLLQSFSLNLCLTLLLWRKIYLCI